ncbi:MAG: AAA family ATPase [Chthoniobacterales bacterium]|nr:AAA family ATPase [Chthoniobacterales bacterium]
MKIDRLISLAIVGGFLDGARVKFASDLNCIIGARGTGKTTLLELVRYALDALPKRELSPSARRRVDSLVEGNLQGGRVELEVETRDGLRYFIVRAVGEAPIVLDASRNATALSLDENAFFRADIFSQNEVESIADHGKFQLELIDSFEPVRVAEMNRAVADITLQIVTQAKQLAPLVERSAALNEKIKQLPMIEEKLKAFGGADDKIAEAVNRAHAAKALRDREGRVVSSVADWLTRYGQELAEVRDRYRAELSGKVTREMVEGPNGQLMNEVSDSLRKCAKAVEQGLNAAQVAVEGCVEVVVESGRQITVAHHEQEIAFRKLIDKHKQHQAQSAERASLERKRNDVLECRAEAAEINKRIKVAEKSRLQLLTQLSEVRDRRFQIRKEVAERLNAALAPMITVVIDQDGAADAYGELIDASLRGSTIRRSIVAKKLTRSLPPQQLADLVRGGDPAALMDRGGLNSDQAAEVVAAFNSPEKLAELETVELQDAPSIKLRVGESQKDSSALSTGQKCTTVLPILLLEGGNPLLIDQPEDNLDNRFIFETVVDSILKVKRSRQLIFVTHNPNIPVLGDASRVFVMESDGERARTAWTGSVDECKEQIVTLLEGGKEAFRRRVERYKA